MVIQKVIDEEVIVYISCCQRAAQHDEQEQYWLELAHKTFNHIQELRSMNRHAPISK